MKQKKQFWVFPLIILGMILMITNSCKKSSNSDNSPTSSFSVSTTTVTNIGQTTATCGGTINSTTGKDTVTSRGVCWSTNQNPTISDTKTIDGSGLGTFTSSLTGLTSNIKYNVRAYAIKRTGVTYGNQVSFTTSNQSTSGGSFSATVDGVAFVATHALGVISDSILSIIGNGTSPNSMILYLPASIKTGSHAMGVLLSNYYAIYTMSSGSSFDSKSGTINITYYNSTTKEIKGTFNFIGSSVSSLATTTITNGQFDITIMN